jgi:Zn-dependent metalloprotease
MVSRRSFLSIAGTAVVLLVSLSAHTASAQGRPIALAATRGGSSELRAWDQEIDRMLRAGDLRLRETVRDAALSDRRHERLDQYHRGLRIVGADLTRQTASDGTVSMFGMVHAGVSLNVTPQISADNAPAAIGGAIGGAFFGRAPELVILPLSDGYHLAYSGQAIAGLEIVNVSVDANSGALLQQHSDFMHDIGLGKGAYGDDKKVSAKAVGGAFVTDDPLRPSAITTYDMKGNLSRLNLILNRFTAVAPSDIASDSDNQWTDSTVVDAHVYAGWYYDYLFKRFGRRGLDDRELRMAVFTHPVRLEDAASAAPDVFGTYYLNAFACGTCGPDGRGAIVLGEGAPRGFFGAVDVKPFGSALDVVAHELTHAVTANSARLNGFPFSEAGSLNEAFSDMFGVSTAFFHLPVGNLPLQASYLQGKDLTVPSGLLSRSLANPLSTRDADHYTQRNIGGDPHANGTIAGHAFYLAIEGGANRTSGQTVQGVGAGNREQIEKSFFRALTMLMPSSATFGLTRIATIQAARDLYGAGSAVERAITQAWDAVGVQERTAPTAALLPNPASPAAIACTGLANPHWVLGITVSAGSSSLRITQGSFDFYDHTGALQDHELFSAANFAQFFNQCGPGSDRVLAQTDACTAFCVDLRGDTTGSSQVTFTATDDAGRPITFSTPRTILLPR